MFRVRAAELRSWHRLPADRLSIQSAGSRCHGRGEPPCIATVSRARIEFQEELGTTAMGEKWIPLGEVKQKGGKIVHAWAFEGDVAEGFTLKSNSFEMEWPPRSGIRAIFPEIDRADFFGLEEARVKINPAQIPFLDRLAAEVAARLTLN
jgi:predicted NUDIX family NTP pyrophosphohydrolase